MQELGRTYPNCGFGGSFYHWIYSDNPQPYNSYDNGAAMRISIEGWVAKSEEQVKQLSKAVTEVSHNHEEGIKGAEAVAMAIFFASKEKNKAEFKHYVEAIYYWLDFTIDQIRDSYEFNETCQDTVPQAIQAFLECNDFEDCIRTAISVGGDNDTLVAITGGIAEAYYGVPDEIRTKVINFLDAKIHRWSKEFERLHSTKNQHRKMFYEIEFKSVNFKGDNGLYIDDKVVRNSVPDDLHMYEL